MYFKQSCQKEAQGIPGDNFMSEPLLSYPLMVSVNKT